MTYLSSSGLCEHVVARRAHHDGGGVGEDNSHLLCGVGGKCNTNKKNQIRQKTQ